MKALRRASGRWTAQVALVVLLVQLFATGFASSVHAQAPRLDAFGNVLCIGGEPDADMPAGDTSGFHDCCTFGCGGSVSSLLSPVDPVVRPAFYPRSTGVLAAAPTGLVPPDRPARPGSPRAPPTAI